MLVIIRTVPIYVTGKVGNPGIVQQLCTMPEHFGQYKNDHFNTQTCHTLTGHCTRFPGQSVPCPDSSG